MEIVFHLGAFEAHHEIKSVVKRMDGSGGKMYNPLEMYSFRMSFCTVPERSELGIPFSSATATYSASSVVAGALIVMEVDIEDISMSSNSCLIS